MPDFTELSTSLLRDPPPVGHQVERPGRPRTLTNTPADEAVRRNKGRRSRFESALVELESRVTPAPSPSVQEDGAAPVDTPTPPAPKPSLVDRRAYPRHGSGSRVAVCRHPKNSTLTSQERNWRLHSTDLRGDLLDISLYGVAFALSTPLPVGETVYLRLSNPRSARSLDVPAIVQRCQPVGDSSSATVQVACTLRRKLSLPEVQLFGRLTGEHVV